MRKNVGNQKIIGSYIVKLSAGTIATLTALVLGLLIAVARRAGTTGPVARSGILDYDHASVCRSVCFTSGAVTTV